VSEIKPLGPKGRGRTGKFTDVPDSLLHLFSQAGARDERRWRLLFGLDPAPPAKNGGKPMADKVRRPPSRKS
jgi:hypothetical protein